MILSPPHTLSNEKLEWSSWSNKWLPGVRARSQSFNFYETLNLEKIKHNVINRLWSSTYEQQE
jgi:hypothetical protein